MRRRLGVLIVIAGLAATALWARTSLWPPPSPGTLRAFGTIEATEVSVASRVPGRVTQLLVAEGSEVRAGQVVARLDAAEMDAMLAQAEAAVETARARVAQAEVALRAQRTQAAAAVAQAEAQMDAARARVPQAEIAQDWQARQVARQVDQARAQVAAAEQAARAASANVAAIEATLVRAQQDLQRLEQLYRAGAVAAQQVDAAQAQVRVLRAQRDAAAAQEAAAERQVTQARAVLAAAEANRLQVGIRRQDTSIAAAQMRQAQAGLQAARAAYDLVRQREQEVAAARAQVAQARAALDLARAQYDHTILRAPAAGMVVTRSAEVGDVVAAGQRLLSIARLDRVWVRVFVPEPDLAHIRVGQPADVFVDAFPHRPFAGTVTEISQQAEFTPRNVQTREERVKQVFGVRITLDNRDRVLKPGMPADAVIKTAGGPPPWRR
ncbi:MAG: efflux RND transporter periplasmic adaptor subunit [Armatimonadota bacterium]|nr:efflux RND transporter periplasmic adaptor subunit [Armatimonadota bacterium]